MSGCAGAKYAHQRVRHAVDGVPNAPLTPPSRRLSTVPTRFSLATWLFH